MRKVLAAIGVIFVFLAATNNDASAKWRWWKWKPRPAFEVSVVSSAPELVTGGDARLHIKVPRTVPLHKVKVLVNGMNQSHHFSRIPGTRKLTGVIDGLQLGENCVTVRAKRRWPWWLSRRIRCRESSRSCAMEQDAFRDPSHTPSREGIS